MLWTKIALQVDGETVEKGDNPTRRAAMVEFLSTGKLRGVFGSEVDSSGRPIPAWKEPDWDQVRIDNQAVRRALDFGGLVPVTATQVTVAHRLACAFGHGWQRVSPEECGFDVEAIRQAARDGGSAIDFFGEIEAPTVYDDGVIRHASGTGRLRWEIGPTETRIEIWRPVGPVLFATVGHGSSEVKIWTQTPTRKQRVEIWERHRDVLAEAVGAIAPTSEFSTGADVARWLRHRGVTVLVDAKAAVTR